MRDPSLIQAEQESESGCLHLGLVDKSPVGIRFVKAGALPEQQFCPGPKEAFLPICRISSMETYSFD